MDVGRSDSVQSERNHHTKLAMQQHMQEQASKIQEMEQQLMIKDAQAKKASDDKD